SGNGGAQTSPSPAPRYHLSSRGTRLFLKRRDLAQQLRVVAPVSQLRGRQGEVRRQVTDLRCDRGGGRRHDATISHIRWNVVRNSRRTKGVAGVMSQGGTRRGNPSRPSRFEFAATAVHLTSVPDCRRRRNMPGAVSSTEKVVAHTLPKLPYDYVALEPHIDRQTMEIHHTKHHQAYINNLNAALDKHPELHKKTLEELLRGINGVPE